MMRLSTIIKTILLICILNQVKKNPTVLPRPFLALDVALAALVVVQVYLGDKLVWVYGLHTVPVVKVIRDGVLS